MKLKWTSTFLTILILLTSCTVPSQPTPDSIPTDIPIADMANPASAYCAEQGYRTEVRMEADEDRQAAASFAMALSATWGHTVGETK